MGRIILLLACREFVEFWVVFFFEVILTTDFSLMSTSIIQESFLFNLKAEQVKKNGWVHFDVNLLGIIYYLWRIEPSVALQHKQYRSPIY